MNEIASCPTCGYPISADYPGQISTCAMCNKTMEIVERRGISQEEPQGGLTLPWVLVAFTIGMFIGPIVIASTTRGRAWLTRTARGG